VKVKIEDIVRVVSEKILAERAGSGA
jgi:hypothetical protein